jgi:hypothetical protein
MINYCNIKKLNADQDGRTFLEVPLPARVSEQEAAHKARNKINSYNPKADKEYHIPFRIL